MEWLNKKATLTNLDKAITFVLENMGRDMETTQKMLTEIRLICEEVFMNVISYAYPAGDGEMQIGYEFDKKSKCMTLLICDSGVEFDPTKAEEPDLTVDIMERQIGGLGIFMVKKIADSVVYERKDKMNVLTIKKSYC